MILNTEINQNYWHFLESSDCQDSDARIKFKISSIQIFSVSEEFSIQTLLQKTKPVVTENHEFEYRDESILKAFFRIFEPFWFWRKHQKCWFFDRILH